jgi:hypothetical protein
LGAAVLAWTASAMIAGEPLLAGVFGAGGHALRWALGALCIAGVLGLSAWRRSRRTTE